MTIIALLLALTTPVAFGTGAVVFDNWCAGAFGNTTDWKTHLRAFVIGFTLSLPLALMTYFISTGMC